MISWLVRRTLPRLSEDVLMPILRDLIEDGSDELVAWLEGVIARELDRRTG